MITGSRPADLDRRLGAQLVDRAVGCSVLAAAAALSWSAGAPVAGVAATAVLVTVLLVVLAAAATWRWGTTPGKALYGLRLVDAVTGEPLRPGAALRRQGMVAVAGLPTLGVGAVAMAAGASTGVCRRAPHDRWCGSLVVEAAGVAAAPAPSPPAHAPGWVNLTALRLLPAGVPDPPTRVRRRSRWQLEVEPAGGPRWHIDLSGPVLLGRDPVLVAGERDVRRVRVADPQVSRSHALVRPGADGTPVLVDRGATNPTVLVRDGRARRVAAGVPTPLAAGDLVRLGGTGLHVLNG